MRDVIEKCIQEQFDDENASVEFSVSKIELALQKGEVYPGSFQIVCTGEEEAKGFLFSTHMRMECEIESFKGNNITVNYQFDTTGLEEGDAVQGDINIITNKGEFSIGFLITVEHTIMETSIGTMKNLFHFANLAKSNWWEAVKFFYSPHFVKILTGNDRQYFSVYKGLSKTNGNEQNVEEFLIEINKKQKVEYIFEQSEIRLDHMEGIVEETITISKNGWGYIHLQIECDGDFIWMQKEFLSDDDFLGNHCSVSVYLDYEKMHGGYNYGCIRFYHKSEMTQIDVVVNTGIGKKNNSLNKEKQLTFELMDAYMCFRRKEVNTAGWLVKSNEIVDQMISLSPEQPEYRLFQAQLLITKERYNEAKWVLDHVANMFEKVEYSKETWCYFLYLNTLYQREESYVNEITREIETIYSQQKSSWKIAWLLLYLREEYSKNPSKKWILLEEQYRLKCISPVIYIEAIMLINANPALLERLDGFELQVLNYAMKHQLLTKGVISQIHYLINRVKVYSNRLLQILIACYGITKEIESLQEICVMLMKGNKTGEEYFKWYALAVEEELRITKLYEFYFLSIPLTYTGTLPKTVLMYFAYHCELGYKRNAFLYAHLLKNKEKYPEMVRSYKQQMENFVVDQLKKGHINKDLAYLYNEFISWIQVSESMARIVAPLLFVYQIEVSDERIKQVVVIHDKVKGEVRYPVTDKKAMISIYSAGHSILFQDEYGNRHKKGIEFILTQLMMPRKMINVVAPYVQNQLGLDIYVCEGGGSYVTIVENNVESYRRLVDSEQIREEYKREIRTKLVRFYYENDQIREMDDYLEQIEPRGMSVKERGEFIQFMVSRGMYDRILQWIKQYGPEGIETKTIVRLCSRTLARTSFEFEPVLLELSKIAFKSNKYDENMLLFLLDYGKGTIKELRNIWRAARDFEINTYHICERIILQMLFSGSYVVEDIEIYRDYLKGGAKTDVKVAFLTKRAYEYFTLDKVMDSSIFKEFIDLYKEDVEISTVCKLALLKHLAEETEELKEEMKEMVKVFVLSFLLKRIYFSFFMEFLSFVPQLDMLSEMTTIQYKANAKSNVVLHYIFEKDTAKDAVYKKESMTHMYGGIFVKHFILFFGESIQYYITEENGGHEQLTESGTIRKNDMVRDLKENKFTLLDDLSIAKTLQDMDTELKLMQEYCKKEYMVENLFKLM